MDISAVACIFPHLIWYGTIREILKTCMKEMTLDAMEFIRRFSLHVLPKGFVRIRHYGICSSSAKEKSALIVKAQVPALRQPPAAISKASPEPFNPKQCPCCKKETMETVMRFNRRGPPAQWKEMALDLMESIKPIWDERGLKN